MGVFCARDFHERETFVPYVRIASGHGLPVLFLLFQGNPIAPTVPASCIHAGSSPSSLFPTVVLFRRVFPPMTLRPFCRIVSGSLSRLACLRSFPRHFMPVSTILFTGSLKPFDGIRSPFPLWDFHGTFTGLFVGCIFGDIFVGLTVPRLFFYYNIPYKGTII